MNTVKKYRREMGLKAVFPGKKPRLTEARKEHKKSPYLLRDLDDIGPNQVWSTDITYCQTKQGTLYLAQLHQFKG